jgi:hypothetical protein
MIAKLAGVLCAGLLACAPATGQAPEGGPWWLQRLYGPEREPHEPFRFWLSAADLAAADNHRPRLRMLVLNPDDGWSIISTEYRCGEDRARRIEARRFDAAGRQMHADTYDDEPGPLNLVTPEAVVYGIVCNRDAAGQVEASTIAASREREAEDHALYLAAVAAAEAERPPVEEPPCRCNILRNPLFGIASAEPASGPGTPIRRTFMSLSQILWAWRTTSGGSPRWSSPESPGDGPLYLAEGESVMQADLGAASGRWRLVIGAARGGEAPANLTGVIEGEEAISFAFDAPALPTLNVVELDLPADGDRLTLTGTGPGEVRLMMVCLSPMD